MRHNAPVDSILVRSDSVINWFVALIKEAIAALGLATQPGDQFSLYYTYLDWPGKESDVHSEEVSQFAEFVGAESGFKAITCQQIFLSLQNEQEVDSDYLDYLGGRYCSNAD